MPRIHSSVHHFLPKSMSVSFSYLTAYNDPLQLVEFIRLFTWTSEKVVVCWRGAVASSSRENLVWMQRPCFHMVKVTDLSIFKPATNFIYCTWYDTVRRRTTPYDARRILTTPYDVYDTMGIFTTGYDTLRHKWDIFYLTKNWNAEELWECHVKNSLIPKSLRQ